MRMTIQPLGRFTRFQEASLHHHIENDSSPFYGSADFDWDWNTIWKDTDPLFVNPSSGDYRLRSGSPAIAVGQGGVDLGAYGGAKGDAWVTPPGDPDAPPAVTGIEIEGPDKVNPGEILQLNAKALYVGYTSDISGVAQWHSSQNTVLSSQGKGQFSAVAAGTSTITLTYSGKQAQLPVTVLEAGLFITQTDSEDPLAKDRFFYVITYRNTGPGVAKNVLITENYDSKLTFVSADPEPDAETDNSWSLGDLAAGESGTITITVDTGGSLTENTSLTSTATIDADFADPVQASETTTVRGVSDLLLSLTDNLSGDQLTYTITYENRGTATAENVVVMQTYDSNTSFVSGNPAPDSGNNHWSVGDLSPGEKGTMTVVISVNGSPNTVTSQVFISSDGGYSKNALISTKLVIKGDVDKDGEITLQDAVDAFRLSFQTSWTSEELGRADYDGDGEVTPQDAVEIFWASF